MTLHDDERQKNLDYHFHPPRHRIWHIAVFFAAMIFLLMAGYVVLSDPAPKQPAYRAEPPFTHSAQ